MQSKQYFFRTEFCQLWYKNKNSDTKIALQSVSNHVTIIPIDLKDNNDPFTLHFRFHCYTRFVSFLSPLLKNLVAQKFMSSKCLAV